MATGDDLLQRLADLIPEYSKGVSAEDSRALRHLNSEQDELEGAMRDLGEDLLLVSATFSTVSAQKRYGLPSDFHAVRYLEYVETDATDQTSRILPLPDIPDKEWAEGSNYYVGSSGNAGKPCYYLMAGDFIELRPIADGVYTVRMWYVQNLPDITASAPVEIPDVLLKTLVYGAAINERVYRRDELQDLLPLYERSRHRALDSLESRYQDGPRTVTYGDDDGVYV